MTKTESNSGVTVLSNLDLDPVLLHFVLLRVDGGIVVHHSGGCGPRQGFGWINGCRALPDEQIALYGALDAGLIAICAPLVEGGDPALVDSVQWLRLIHLGSTVIKGNPVAITLAGQKRLAAMKPPAVLVGAA